ncbi:uncharacterized protein [Narcine bancroftii]|uniref:uncharacterized protein n=1 Tax=Narcine bancroftii TaxID=1343680 RepID=UPI0038311984
MRVNLFSTHHPQTWYTEKRRFNLVSTHHPQVLNTEKQGFNPSSLPPPPLLTSQGRLPGTYPTGLPPPRPHWHTPQGCSATPGTYLTGLPPPRHLNSAPSPPDPSSTLRHRQPGPSAPPARPLPARSAPPRPLGPSPPARPLPARSAPPRPLGPSPPARPLPARSAPPRPLGPSPPARPLPARSAPPRPLGPSPPARPLPARSAPPRPLGPSPPARPLPARSAPPRPLGPSPPARPPSPPARPLIATVIPQTNSTAAGHRRPLPLDGSVLTGRLTFQLIGGRGVTCAAGRPPFLGRIGLERDGKSRTRLFSGGCFHLPPGLEATCVGPRATGMSQSKAPRFSDAAVQILVEQVRSRSEDLFPSDGSKLPRQTLRQAWKEVAVSVNTWSDSPRTGEQCRKKFNDLTRTARDKLAQRRSCVLHLTRMEQEALELWRASRRRMEKQPAAVQPPQGLSHSWAAAGQGLEKEQPPKGAATTTLPYSTPGAGSERDNWAAVSTLDELFGKGDQDSSAVGRLVEETRAQRQGPLSSQAESNEDRDVHSPAFRHRVFHVHHQLLEALDSLSSSCLALSQSTESAPTLAQLLLQTLSGLQCLSQRAPGYVAAARKSSTQASVGPVLASLVQHQTAALQGLVCSVSTGLERLRERVDGGFDRVSHLLQSVLPRGSSTVDTERQGSFA